MAASDKNPPASLQQQRLVAWRQLPEHRLKTVEEAADFIRALGIVTLYPTSPEFPDLFRAFMGQADATTDLDWDGKTRLPTISWSSPASTIYTWRWQLGVQPDLFYTTLIRKRPTWISQALIAPVLVLRGERRSPEELYHAGLISGDARRIATVLATADAPLKTSDLRRLAGFPTGKEQRAAFQKAIAELDARLIICKTFLEGQEDMAHALTATSFPAEVAFAATMSEQEAITTVLNCYLSCAHYIQPALFARHLAIAPAIVQSGLRSHADGHYLQEQAGGIWVYRGPQSHSV